MSFLRPVDMVKFRLVGLKDDRETLLSVLHDLGVVQVEPIGKEALGEFEPERVSDLGRHVGDQAIRFRALKAALPPTPAGPPRSFPTLQSLFDEAEKVPIDDEVGALKREEDHLLTERKEVQDNLDLLAAHAYYTDRLEYLHGRSVLSFFGEAPPELFDALKAEVGQMADSQLLEARSAETVHFLLAVRATQAEAVSRFAQQKGVTLVAAPDLTGTPAEAQQRLTSRRQEIDARLSAIGQRLTELSRTWYPVVLPLEEGFTIENRKLEVYTRLGASRATFVLEGWVPKRSRPALEAAVVAATGNRTHITDLATEEEPPTLMDNPTGVRRFEFFIRFYSLPTATEWDPTWVFAIVFPLFFGFMLADWGYGLTILLICLWMIRGFPGRQYLPRSIKNFVKLIMGPAGMQSLAYALVPGTLLAIALGVASDEFFGAHALHVLFGYTALYDPVASTGKLLLLAGFIGLGMVELGFFLGALQAYYHHHRKEIVSKVGGMVTAAGVAAFGLSIIKHAPTLWVAVFLVITLAGFFTMLLGGFQHAMMGAIEVVSHILSFTRLVGILLASVILALVINTISYGLFQGNSPLGPIGGIVVGLLILVVGQTFNVILGVFEPGIQGARLIFVEHFSKFYGGNGRPFQPFRSTRRYTLANHHAPAPSAP